MEWIERIDHLLFGVINHAPHTPLLDFIAQALSGVGNTVFVWVALVLWLFYKEERRHHTFLLPFISAAISAWFVVDHVLKPLIARSRPGWDVGAIIVVAVGGHSFPSGHAAVAFALAYVCAQFEPRALWKYYVLATLIALSRVYLGVHYPIDIVVGAILGVMIGKCVLWIFTATQKRYTIIPQRRDTHQKKRGSGSSHRLKRS